MGTRDIRFAIPKAPRGQQVLFPQCLDDVVGPDEPVRALARLLEEVDWSPWERAYEGCGQPPIHPRYLAGAILYGLMHKVRSTRDLETACRKHLDFIWLLEGFTPDHSTFADFRLRHEQGIKDLKKGVACALLARRERALMRLIIDGTRMRADSDWHGARKAETIECIIAELERRMEEMVRGDEAAAPVQLDALEGTPPEPDPPQAVAQSNEQAARLENERAKYQRALEAARERDARARQHDGKNAKPVRVPVTDPESHVLPNKEGGYAPNYTPIAAIEPQTGAIAYDDVLEGSDEASAVLPAVLAFEELTGCKVSAVLADGNFATGEVLEALGARSTEAYMPTTAASRDNPAVRPDPSQPVAEADRARLPKRGKHLARTAFIYDQQSDIYYCPMGHTLTPYKHGNNKDGVPCTYYQCQNARDCPLAKTCIKGKNPFRTLTRDPYEPLREATAQRMATPEGRAIYKARAPGIEGVFGIIKSILGIRRFTLRGLTKVRIEWSWICTAYNLKKLLALEARIAPKGIQPGGGPFFCAPKRLYTRPRPAYGAFLIHKTNHQILRPIRTIGHHHHVQTAAAA
jgi:transposase